MVGVQLTSSSARPRRLRSPTGSPDRDARLVEVHDDDRDDGLSRPCARTAAGSQLMTSSPASTVSFSACSRVETLAVKPVRVEAEVDEHAGTGLADDDEGVGVQLEDAPGNGRDGVWGPSSSGTGDRDRPGHREDRVGHVLHGRDPARDGREDLGSPEVFDVGDDGVGLGAHHHLDGVAGLDDAECPGLLEG